MRLGLREILILPLVALAIGKSPAISAEYNDGDACAEAGATHRKSGASGFDFLVCDGANWQSALSFPAAGGEISIDNDPAIGSAGCFRYDGTSSQIEYSHNCTTYQVLGDTSLWTQGSADDLYYSSGSYQVGIGTSTPSYELDVNGVIRATDHFVVDATAGATTPNYFDLNDLASVTLSSPANGEVLQYDGTDWVNATASGGSGLWSAGTGDDIYYNSGTPMVGIGNTNPDVELDVTGDIEFTGTITDVSDRRLKENLVPLSDRSADVLTLDGYAFNMKGDPEQTVEFGLMAQDVEVVFPELVVTKDDDVKTLNYLGLIAPIVEQLKAQNAEIEKLRAEIKALKTQDKDSSGEP